jgi:hypothetical protein
MGHERKTELFAVGEPCAGAAFGELSDLGEVTGALGYGE